MMDLSSYYSEKRKKKRDKESTSGDHPVGVKAKPIRNFKIIDDDIDLDKIKPSEEAEALADLLDPEGPSIANDYDQKFFEEKTKPTAKKENLFTATQWVTLESENDLNIETDRNAPDKSSSNKSLFRKRGEKIAKVNVDDDENDNDLDLVPRRRKSSETNVVRKDNGDDSDLDLLPRKNRSRETNDSDLDDVPRRRPTRHDTNDSSSSSHRKSRSTRNDSRQDANDSKHKQRSISNEKDSSPERKEEKMAKYMEWGKGLVQKREKEEKLKEDLDEAEKPLARYKNDQDLDRLLKDKEREDDPMLEYLRSKSNKDDLSGKLGGEKLKPTTAKYRGPPAPPNRYNILPGSRWDGVDRSNGFEKKYFESIMAKKAREEEAYKWSIEDM